MHESVSERTSVPAGFRPRAGSGGGHPLQQLDGSSLHAVFLGWDHDHGRCHSAAGVHRGPALPRCRHPRQRRADHGRNFPNSGLRTGTSPASGIPAGADAISVNFSVVSTAATPLGAFLLAWPTGQAPPPTAIMTYGPGATIISNAAIVPLGPSDELQVNVSHSTHVVMDVNGSFSDLIETGANFLRLVNTNPGGATAAFGNFSAVNNSSGVVGTAGAGCAAELLQRRGPWREHSQRCSRHFTALGRQRLSGQRRRLRNRVRRSGIRRQHRGSSDHRVQHQRIQKPYSSAVQAPCHGLRTCRGAGRSPASEVSPEAPRTAPQQLRAKTEEERSHRTRST